jgi:alpha-galactosidase
MSAETRDLLTNPEVIAVDQDPKGVQGHRVREEGPLEIWVKPLADGSQAVGLFNRTEAVFKIQLDSKLIAVSPAAKLRDLLDHKDLGAIKESYTTEVPQHGVVMLRVSN